MNKSIGPNLKYIKQIEEQNELIGFLKAKYKEQTGYEAQIPQTFSQSQFQSKVTNIEATRSILVPHTKSLVLARHTEVVHFPEEEEKIQIPVIISNFDEAVKHLQLPQIKAPNDKKTPNRRGPTTSFDVKNKFHTIQMIDLSNFKISTKYAFKDFVDSIHDMHHLHTLIMRHNGLNDSLGEEIGQLLLHSGITKLDISHNEISPKGMKPLITGLKQLGIMKWIDLTRNAFSHDLQTITLLSQALILCPHLIHCTLDAFRPPHVLDKHEVLYKGADVICKMALQHKSLSSLHLIDSHITNDGIHLLNQLLISNKHHLIELNLKILAHAIQKNRTLVHLDLQHNNIDNAGGIYICEMLSINHSLYSLNLQHNSLSCDFITHLAEVLIKNNVVAMIHLGFNNFETKGIRQLLKMLGTQNHTIFDLGQIDRNPIDACLVEEISQKLSHNKIIQSGRNPEDCLEEESSNYRILKGIDFAGALRKNQTNFKLWQI